MLNIRIKTNIMKKILFLFLSVLIVSMSKSQVVETGIEQLRKQNFKILEGKRVGLITNPTGVDSKLKSTVDILFEAPNVKLVALFAPEHGVRGNYAAGDKVEHEVDALTKLPVHSLHGKTKKPTPEMLKGIDVLVYDIQDIGSRSYTFISTLGLTMEAAAENNIEFVVLDRPNPLGGERIEGTVTEKAFTSFVSQFPIPYIHGLTCGELAQYLNKEGLLQNKVSCKLQVVPMLGWKRNMLFDETGLPWVLSSPHLPHAWTTLFYPATGIFGELSFLNIGVGYTMPFELMATNWIKDPQKLAKNLNDLKLPGILFRPIYYKPYYSHFNGETIAGVQIHLTDPKLAPLPLIQFYVMQECYKLYPTQNIFTQNKEDRIKMFDKVCGTDKIRLAFEKKFRVSDILPLWNIGVSEYRGKLKSVLLYE